MAIMIYLWALPLLVTLQVRPLQSTHLLQHRAYGVEFSPGAGCRDGFIHGSKESTAGMLESLCKDLRALGRPHGDVCPGTDRQGEAGVLPSTRGLNSALSSC